MGLNAGEADGKLNEKPAACAENTQFTPTNNRSESDAPNLPKSSQIIMNSPPNNTAASSASATAPTTTLLPRKRQANKSPPAAFSPDFANKSLAVGTAASDDGGDADNNLQNIASVAGTAGNMQHTFANNEEGDGSELKDANNLSRRLANPNKIDTARDTGAAAHYLNSSQVHMKGTWARDNPSADDLSCGSCSEDMDGAEEPSNDTTNNAYGPRASLHASFELVASSQQHTQSVQPDNSQQQPSLSNPIPLGKSKSSDFVAYTRKFSTGTKNDDWKRTKSTDASSLSISNNNNNIAMTAITNANSPSASFSSPKRRKGNLFPETPNNTNAPPLPPQPPKTSLRPSLPPLNPTHPSSPLTFQQGPSNDFAAPPQTVVKARKKGRQSSSFDEKEHLSTLQQSMQSSSQPIQQPQQMQNEPLQQPQPGISSNQQMAPTPQRIQHQQQKRCRQSRLNPILFSPKPIASSSNNRMARPPRPSGAGSNAGGGANLGDRSSLGASGTIIEPNYLLEGIAGGTTSPLTSSPATPANNSLMLDTVANSLNNTSSNSNSTGYDSSPATPFRFHAFPASLPRVNPRNTDGTRERADGTSLFFSSTPFRLDAGNPPLNEEEGSVSVDTNDDQSTVKSGPKRLLLRPKAPSSPTPGGYSKRRLTPRNYNHDATTATTPTTHKELFNSLNHSDTSHLLAPSFDAAEEEALADAVIAPAFSHDQTDVSGDWSEGPSMVNERMPHVPSHGVGPASSFGGLKFLREEEDEGDAVMGDEEEDDDVGGGKENCQMEGGNGKLQLTLSRTKLNFFSPSMDRAGSELESSGGERNSEKGPPGLENHAANLFGSTHPHTPRGTEPFNFHHLEFSQVSPIVRHPDDDDGMEADISMREELEGDDDNREDGESHRAPMQPLFPDDSPERGGVPSSSISNRSSEVLFPNSSGVNTTANSATTHLSAGNTSANSASTANVNNTTAMSNASNTRKFRPMPDTSAFDICTPSQQSMGSNDARTSDQHSTSRLLCPPTPVRTPAWAHADTIRPNFSRANSLVATKVLAACPPQVLDCLSSLEDSMLENDISGSTLDAETHPTLQTSFAPVEEKEEDESMESRDVDNGESESFHPSDDKFPSDLSPINAAANANVRKTRFSTEGMADLSSIGSFNTDFQTIRTLGRGAFADVYKVRSKSDNRLYAIKRSHRQFRGVKDRERAMAEVQTMQRLQSASVSVENSGNQAKCNYGLYLLFFIRAWQEDGYFYCQTELCCRATCRHLRLSLTSEWEKDVVKFPSLQSCLGVSNDAVSERNISEHRLLPERTVLQICHDIARGLHHIHSYGMVHYDIKPSNLFLVSNARWGTICKIGDFGLAGDIGTVDDGQEGDTAYMPNELLSSTTKHPGADIFSLGLTLYELAASSTWALPTEGERWHAIRSESHAPDLPKCRSEALVKLIKSMLHPKVEDRPTSGNITENPAVKSATASTDSFLSHYVNDVDKYDSEREKEIESAQEDAGRRTSTPVAPILNHHRLSGSGGAPRSFNIRTPTSGS